MASPADRAASVTPAMVAYGRGLGEPRLSPDGTSVAYVATVQGRGQLCVVSSDRPEVVLTTEPAPPAAQSYGGGVFDWRPDGAGLVYAARDGCLYEISAQGGPARLLAEPVGSGAALTAPAAGDAVLVYVQSGADHDQVMSIGSRRQGRDGVPGGEGSDGRWPALVARADFCFDPAVSGRIAWHEWSVPDMAWDAGRICLTDAQPGGAPGRGPVVAGGPGESVGQPRFSPDGTWLAYTSDRSGFANVWVAPVQPLVFGADGLRGAKPVAQEDFEHADPAWGQGQRSFAWSPDGRSIAYQRNEGGFGRLVVADLATGERRELSKGIHGGLSWHGDRIVCVRSGARTPTHILVVDPVTGNRTAVAHGPAGGWDDVDLIEPEVVHWRAVDGAEVHGRLYRPAYSAGPHEAPPLLCWIHGGPTGQWPVTFRERFAYYLAKGWAILVPDHRGSTGWGRAYTQAMRERWGDVDVSDTVAGIRHAVAEQWCDARRIVMIGGSAGGFTVLGVLAREPDLCAAGVDLFGVADLLDLDETTHRFEKHYNSSLVGPLPEAVERYRERSPVHFAERITAPLLILQGSADPVVPLAQSRAIADRLRGLGRTVELHVYEGEGHGWSRPDVVVDEITRIDDFLRRHVLRGRAG